MLTTSPNRAKLRRAIIQWLPEWKWEWYVTLTFGEEVHPEYALRRFRIWIDWVNRKLYGRNYRKKGVGVHWVCFLEHQFTGRVHFHALLGDVTELNSRLSIVDAKHRWNKTDGFADAQIVYGKIRTLLQYMSKEIGETLAVPRVESAALNCPRPNRLCHTSRVLDLRA